MSELITLGWREWATLPELHIPAMKIKVDTGARTSALHAFEVTEFQKGDEDWVRFSVHPNPRNVDEVVVCEAPVFDRREVTDSGGHTENRIVIQTTMGLGGVTWPIEVTLTNRDTMKFRMLLGRTAMCGQFVVDPSASFKCGGGLRKPPQTL